MAMEKSSSIKFGILIILLIVLYFTMKDDNTQKPEKKYDFNRIEMASNQQIDYIKSGLKNETNVKINKVYAIKTNSFKNAYFVGTKLTGPGMESGEIGVWIISGNKNQPGMIFSVNGIAVEFSSYPDASKTKMNATMADDGADILKKYLNDN